MTLTLSVIITSDSMAAIPIAATYTIETSTSVTGLWTCLLLGGQRNSVWIINGEGGDVEESVNVGREVGVQGC